MDPVKVQGVTQWPTPTCKKEVQSFLGFLNFYCHFIRGFGDIAKPLTSLTGNTSWTWGDDQQHAFDTLKTSVTSAPVLTIPTDSDPFRVKADSSGHTLGAILSQFQHSTWCPIAFLLKSLSETECNYEIYDQELLAIMTALSEWRHHLMGSSADFEIWMDHQNLVYFRKSQKLNRQQACWVTEPAGTCPHQS